MVVFSKGELFTYNLRHKHVLLAWLIGIVSFIVILGGVVWYTVRFGSGPVSVVVTSVVNHLVTEISVVSVLGVLYTALIGGLFFISLPMEALYASFLRTDISWLVLLGVYLFGLTISFSINYFLGLKVGSVAKRLITPQKFYKIQGLMNRYGVWALFGFNVLPLPSQALGVILGMLRYSKKRFYTFFLLGQCVKLLIMTFIFRMLLGG
ncbi:VTT domain-containing protein [Candidatus Woesearchaeota archaeon]|nr:VTT domain-containing protein [Candidatus Woesearchaeota archaeon]